MNSNIQTLSHPPLVWEDVLPQGFTGLRLPGGNLLSATGDLGSLCVQEYASEYYTIRYNVFDKLKDCILKSGCRQTGLYIRLVLQGNVHLQINAATKWKLGKNQFGAIHEKDLEVISTYNEQQTFRSIDVFFSPQWVEELSGMIKELKNDAGHSAGFPLQPPHWADADTLELVHAILHCPYEKQLHRYFFDSRLREFLYKILMLSVHTKTTKNSPTPMEIEAVLKAEHIISSDIKKHHHISALARQVHLNEFQFKTMFKKVFGRAPYKYLIKLRMDKARELLQAGISVKETALLTGYRPSDFSEAFIQHFGFGPSTVNANNS